MQKSSSLTYASQSPRPDDSGMSNDSFVRPDTPKRQGCVVEHGGVTKIWARMKSFREEALLPDEYF